MSKFERVDKLPKYIFADLNDKKIKYIKSGKDVIDFGMGSPDLPPHKSIVDKLIEVSKRDDVHGYFESQGIPELRKAISYYYHDRYNVDFDHDKEVVVTLGSKEGITNFAKAISSLGDTVFVPTPGYPIHTYSFKIVDVDVRHISDEGSNEELLQKIKQDIPIYRPKAIVISYPNNPTTKMATIDFFQELVDICRYHKIYIISDLAYCELYYGENRPLSIFEAKGARDVAVEFTSVSKTFSMAGWRIGFACGNLELISALKKIKSYLDYGNFYPIQAAAAYALNNYKELLPELRSEYKNRRDLMVNEMNSMGWHVDSPEAGMFIWAKIPEKYKNYGSMDFTNLLLDKTLVAVTPGLGFGEIANNRVRFALVQSQDRIKEAMERIKKIM